MNPGPRPRFIVVTVHGYLSPVVHGSRAKPGLSATVIDRACQASPRAEVAIYRSEDPVSGMGQGKRLGVAGAVNAADRHADRLNARYGPWPEGDAA